MFALRRRDERCDIDGAAWSVLEIDALLEHDDSTEQPPSVDLATEPRTLDVGCGRGGEQDLARVGRALALDRLRDARAGDHELTMVAVEQEERERADVHTLRDSQPHSCACAGRERLSDEVAHRDRGEARPFGVGADLDRGSTAHRHRT